MTTEQPALIEHHPALDATRTKICLPIAQVTLLEDRAQVVRRGRIDVAPGRNRLALWDVAPVLQDVSLRCEVTSGGRVEDARVRRALRIGHRELPPVIRALEEKLQDLARRYDDTRELRQRVQARLRTVHEMMHKTTRELPDDAAWSIGNPSSWGETFELLSKKGRALWDEQRAQRASLEDLRREADSIVQRRSLLDRPDHKMLALLELDVMADATTIELEIEYTVPCALWRPFHCATLRDKNLVMSSQAAVWQNTGEDWVDVELRFSTARSSLGHEPPRLSDDRLAAKKKEQKVVVEAREVSIQQAGLGRGGGGAPAVPAGVSLPGVDDGGDIQNLRAIGRTTVPSDGRPAFVPVFAFASEADTSLIVMAEVDDKAFFKATATHTGSHPLLAGPVELVRTSGFVGNTKTLFVAPGEKFAVGFGPDDDMRVRRNVEQEDELDEVDRWKRKTTTVSVYLSNIGGEEKLLEVVERMPVSEIEHVKVTLLADKTSGAPTVDADGLVRWNVRVPAQGRMRLNLVYVVATAPGVSGL